MKTAASIIIVVAALIFAFFLGRSSYTPEPPKVVERWRTKHDTVEYRDTVKIPVPQVIVRDTTIYLPGEIDTAALLAGYLARKEYPLDFSNDSIGEFRVDITIQRNALTEVVSHVKPLIRVHEVERTIIDKQIPFIQGYAQIGTSVDFGTQKFSAGADFRQRFLVGASAIRVDDQWGYTLDFGIKF